MLKICIDWPRRRQRAAGRGGRAGGPPRRGRRWWCRWGRRACWRSSPASRAWIRSLSSLSPSSPRWWPGGCPGWPPGRWGPGAPESPPPGYRYRYNAWAATIEENVCWANCHQLSFCKYFALLRISPQQITAAHCTLNYLYIRKQETCL